MSATSTIDYEIARLLPHARQPTATKSPRKNLAGSRTRVPELSETPHIAPQEKTRKYLI